MNAVLCSRQLLHSYASAQPRTLREHLERALAFREAGGWIPASQLAMGFTAIGETDVALDWLERSFREEGSDYMLREPDFDPLRAEPRFQVLWDQVGLPGAKPPGG